MDTHQVKLTFNQSGIMVGNGAIRRIKSMLVPCESNHCPVYPCIPVGLLPSIAHPISFWKHSIISASPPCRKWVPDFYHFLQLQMSQSREGGHSSHCTHDIPLNKLINPIFHFESVQFPFERSSLICFLHHFQAVNSKSQQSFCFKTNNFTIYCIWIFTGDLETEWKTWLLLKIKTRSLLMISVSGLSVIYPSVGTISKRKLHFSSSLHDHKILESVLQPSSFKVWSLLWCRKL